QIPVYLRFALRFCQASHGVEVIYFDAIEIVFRLGVDDAEDRIGVRLAEHMGNAPIVSYDGDALCFPFPCGGVFLLVDLSARNAQSGEDKGEEPQKRIRIIELLRFHFDLWCVLCLFVATPLHRATLTVLDNIVASPRNMSPHPTTFAWNSGFQLHCTRFYADPEISETANPRRIDEVIDHCGDAAICPGTPTFGAATAHHADRND